MGAKKLSTGLSGIAGEHLVAAELSKQGYLASIMLRNTKGVDIMAYNQEVSKSVAIQVKTNQSSTKAWLLKAAAEGHIEFNFFYVFVNLESANGNAEFHIVPSKIVANYIKRTHQEWLNTPGKKGQKRNDSSMRKFFDLDDKYLDKWKLLGLD